MLSDSSCFSLGDGGFSEGIEEGGLSVIDVALEGGRGTRRDASGRRPGKQRDFNDWLTMMVTLRKESEQRKSQRSSSRRGRGKKERKTSFDSHWRTKRERAHVGGNGSASERNERERVITRVFGHVEEKERREELTQDRYRTTSRHRPSRRNPYPPRRWTRLPS